MEFRKNQLQKQIIEALQANDNDLYLLLKSQWAHRFGVESLEELQNLDKILENEKITKDDKSENNFSQVDKEISITDDDSNEKEITNETNKGVNSAVVDSLKSYEIKSHDKVDNENHEKKPINPIREYNNPPKVEALIPLPPKPKYSFLKKWLLRS